MTSQTKMALITILVVVVVGTGAILTYIYRDTLFTAVGTGGPPGGQVTIEKLINGSDNVTLMPGESVNVSINFKSTASIAFSYGSLVDDYDENYVTVSNISNGGVDSGAQIDWPGDTFPVPVNETFTYTMTLNSIIPVGTVFTNTATINPEPPPASSTVTITVGGPQLDPNLTLSKSVDDLNGSPVERGDTLEYTVTVGNTGAGDASGVQVTENIPNKLESFSVPVPTKPATATDSSTATGGLSGNGFLDINTFDIPAGGNETIQYTVVVSDTANNNEQIDNVVVADCSNCPSPAQAQDQVVVSVETGGVILQPELTLVKNVRDVNGSPVEQGDLLEYTVTIGNVGQAAATGIKVVEDIPVLLEQFSVPVLAKPTGSIDDSTATGGAFGNGYLDVNSFTLAPTESSTIVYTVVVSDDAKDNEQIDNVVTATHSQSKEPLKATASVTVSVPAGPVVVAAPTTPQTTSAPTQPVVVPQVGVDPSLIALGGSGAASMLVGAGYYLSRRRKKK